MTWGMEDPAARAREQLALQHDDAWGRPPRRRRSREGLLVVAFIVLSAVAIWFTLQHEEDAAADADRAAAVERATVGLSGRSLARPANLTPVLARMRAQAGAGDGVVSVRVAPAHVSATMISPTGDEYSLDAGLDGVVTRHGSGASDRTTTSGLDDVRPADIRRAVLTVSRHSGLAPRYLDYLVVSDPGSAQSIFVRFDAPAVRDRDWIGTGDGRTMRRVTPGAPQGAVQRLAACVEAAGTDVAAIQRCLE